jgi:hypothetical protein
METQDLRKRTNLKPVSAEKSETRADGKVEEHPAGSIKHAAPVEILRLLLMVTYWIGSTTVYVCAQVLEKSC